MAEMGPREERRKERGSLLKERGSIVKEWAEGVEREVEVGMEGGGDADAVMLDILKSMSCTFLPILLATSN